MKGNITVYVNLLTKVLSFFTLLFFSKGSKVPTASDTRWVYHCQLADFAWTHMLSIVSALIEIHESNKESSDTAKGYAICFTNEKFIYEVGIMKIILGHAKSFLKQTENRSITFDKFSVFRFNCCSY